MSKNPTFLDPKKEAEAVSAIMASEYIDAYDEDLVHDTIEGETSFYEAVDVLLERMANAEVMIAGIKAFVEKLDARRARHEQRLKSDRALLEQAMTIADLPKLERPTATLSLSARAPGLTITEESDIPATYWKPSAPTLDKKALLAALKERANALAALPDDAKGREAIIAALAPEIPGATLSNGAPSLTIRRA